MLIKDRKEIVAATNSYDTLKHILEGIELEVNDTFVDIIRETFKWVLGECDEE